MLFRLPSVTSRSNITANLRTCGVFEGQPAMMRARAGGGVWPRTRPSDRSRGTRSMFFTKQAEHVESHLRYSVGSTCSARLRNHERAR